MGMGMGVVELHSTHAFQVLHGLSVGSRDHGANGSIASGSSHDKSVVEGISGDTGIRGGINDVGSDFNMNILLAFRAHLSKDNTGAETQERSDVDRMAKGYIIDSGYFYGLPLGEEESGGVGQLKGFPHQVSTKDEVVDVALLWMAQADGGHFSALHGNLTCDGAGRATTANQQFVKEGALFSSWRLTEETLL